MDFDSSSKSFNERKDTEMSSVKLIEPSQGRIVELQVIEPNEEFSDLHMKNLKSYAKNLEAFGIKWKVVGKTIKLTFPDEIRAEKTREIWKR